MSFFKPTPYIDYLPAKLAEGKEWYVHFSVKDPLTSKMKRIKHKINHLKTVNRKVPAIPDFNEDRDLDADMELIRQQFGFTDVVKTTYKVINR